MIQFNAKNFGDEISKIDYLISAKYDNIKKGNIEYIEVPCSFDIETTSTYYYDDKVAFMYIWAFAITENIIVYGRTWNEFIDLTEILVNIFHLDNDKRRLIVYIHNLSFEFQFFRKYFNWVKVFASDDRKPIYAITNKGIEFRDSLILSGYSLAKLAENLTSHSIKKLIGDLDYSLIRHFKTVITNDELEYLKNDVLILIYYVLEQKEIYKNISEIPLTNTGRVRNFVRNKCLYTNETHNKSSHQKYNRYRKLMQELTITPQQYIMMKRCFCGGFTHSSMLYTNQLIKDVYSIDISSSYPYAMLSEKFPMSAPIPIQINNRSEFMQYINSDNYGLMFDIHFTKIQSKLNYETYLSESKCVLENEIVNNGRVFYADDCITTITDVDFRIIEHCYTWDSIQITNVYKFYMEYLPRPIILAVIELYQKKTELKDIEGKEVEYLLSKGMLNSSYGMTVTDIIQDSIEYDQMWLQKKLTQEEIQTQIDNYNNSKKRFLYYAWGLYVTAYARRNLWTAILNIKDDYIYSDTDSVKFLNYEKHKMFIEYYNEGTQEKLKRMCDFRKIDYNELLPKNKKGSIKKLGIYEFEKHYHLFKTLGAKRYLWYDGDKMQLTVAGLSKQNGLQYMLRKCNNNKLKVFDMFTDQLYIPSNETGKMTHTYIDETKKIAITDYQGNTIQFETLSGVHLEKCDFTLSISKKYANFLDSFMKGYITTGTKFV